MQPQVYPSEGQTSFRFPFGAPVLRRLPSASSHRRVFVLGAYPSALHVRWIPPGSTKAIRAIPVDNEPEPFWDGIDEAEKVAAWKRVVGFDTKPWGATEPAGKLNGSSGAWLRDRVFVPFGIKRDAACVTDVLDTYRMSDDAEEPITKIYARLPATAKAPTWALAPHPSESQIVQEGLKPPQRQRLMDELRAAQPIVIVTLGNAALRVLRELLAESGGTAAPASLSAGTDYGNPVTIHLDSKAITWYPLVHPGAYRKNPDFRAAHDSWVTKIHADHDFAKRLHAD